MRLDAPEDDPLDASCPCSDGTPCIQCQDCLPGFLLCQACTVSAHQQNPLHIIGVRAPCSLGRSATDARSQEWNGSFFSWVLLQALGLTVQLGHPNTGYCPNPQRPIKSFVVLHTNGIHELTLSFCSCSGAPSSSVQLLRALWWPATAINPRTAATMCLLRHFSAVNMCTRANAMDFYKVLEHHTDAWRLDPPPVRARLAFASIYVS
jgi:hypothetical protein